MATLVRTRRWLLHIGLLLVALVLLLLVGGWLMLRASLPRLDGEMPLQGLSAPVDIRRDALGMVTIDAASQADAMRALGFVHSQERFFEMDLMRRSAAGELAELFGPAAVPADRRARVHRFRSRVAAHLDTTVGDKGPVLEAYVQGVNAGLQGLDARPWPYLLLGTRPAPWLATDTPLVGHAMYFDLQDAANARELALWRMGPHLPPALLSLLTRDGTAWDAPITGDGRGDAELPDASEVDLRMLPAADLPRDADARIARPVDVHVGSNNFAVAGMLTTDGRAIVADDMHLGLRAPNLWFRARLRYPDPQAPGGRVDVAGFTLPGMPGVVVGSNGQVAWGFTNSYGDWLDWARLPPCTAAATTCPPVARHVEQIRVAGGEPVELVVDESPWGPVLHREADGSALALRWVAHLPGAVDLGLLDMARAGSLDDAMRLRAALPAQNLLAGDARGRIGWRLLGPLPRRGAGCAPAGMSDPARCPPWPIALDDPPRVSEPETGRLWTANARVVDGAALSAIGDGGYALGARAMQIRDALSGRQRFDEAALLDIQLDDRALFLRRWWELLQAEAAANPDPAMRALAAAAGDWQGHASVDSASYRIVRAWRLSVHERIADGLAGPARVALGEAFEMPALHQLEGVAWPLLQQRPAHLLPPRYASWGALLEEAAGEVRDELAQAGPLAGRTWGERNTARICHPLARVLPGMLRPRLCMPFDQLPGDSHLPRVQGPDKGASQRMVVAPGHEQDGIAHMPGGQSGHPLSPFWGAGHADWVQGRPSPFLPGNTEHILRLVPH